jgi:hypothetical protein
MSFMTIPPIIVQQSTPITSNLIYGGINYKSILHSLVFTMLLEEGMISEDLMENMRNWKHSGFSINCAEPIEACDDNGRKTLSEYISRAPFSLERMSFNEGSDTVLYRGEHFHPTLARNIEVKDPLEWIAHITSHIA